MQLSSSISSSHKIKDNIISKKSHNPIKNHSLASLCLGKMLPHLGFVFFILHLTVELVLTFQFKTWCWEHCSGHRSASAVKSYAQWSSLCLVTSGCIALDKLFDYISFLYVYSVDKSDTYSSWGLHEVRASDWCVSMQQPAAVSRGLVGCLWTITRTEYINAEMLKGLTVEKYFVFSFVSLLKSLWFYHLHV